MPADMFPSNAIPGFAVHIDSPAKLRVLRQVCAAGQIRYHLNIHPDLFAALQAFARLGLVDPGYSGPLDGPPDLWLSNHNGERLLKHFDSSCEDFGV